ncbi:hypothetical protein [Tepidimicrobium xylanilyticum]|uniref:hypothetical protein n=1 Tax=Tepidimicrobium xylanilyticum TaxID=1123352 RepID=UPI00264D2327|nr:hypothetical protein [Tepidimicrobium xylanilyticum]GMG95855.1 hypothetical protein EN5CB1_06810 [Tepidimicrobium xylanilyticum]
MKNFIEKLKDLLYDGIDYIVMVFIIVTVVLIINWRLDGLFAKDAVDDIVNKPTNEIESNLDDENRHTDIEENPNDDSNNDVIDNGNENTGDNGQNNIDAEEVKELVKITIPSGTLPPEIGDILVANGLINNRNEFLNKVVELKMETKLKSGEYEIERGLSIEDIIGILTK